MRCFRILALLAFCASLAGLYRLTRPTPEGLLRDVIGGQAPPSLRLLNAGWGGRGWEDITTFVHFRIAPDELDPLLKKGRFWVDADGPSVPKGQMNFWNPPAWWDPARLAGPVVRYRAPYLHDDAPWDMRLFVDAARSEVYGVRQEWWR